MERVLDLVFATFLTRLTVVVGAIALTVVAIEIGLRLYGYEAFRWSDRVNPQLLTATGNDELPYVLTPGASGRGWDTDVTINSHGFRDREYPESKPEDVIRIAAVGDSITFGSRIPDVADLFPKQLERRLRRHRRSRRAEVLNFGVTGFDVVNNVENVRIQALRFQPDAVVLAFCVNDIGYASTAMAYVEASRHIGHPIFRARTAQYVFSAAMQLIARHQSRQDESTADFERVNRSRLRSVENDRELTRLMTRLAAEPRGRFNQDIIRWWTEAPRLAFLEYAFTKLSQMQRDHGFAVVVVPVPFLDRASVSQWRVINDMIRHESEKFGFHVVDLAAPFEAAGLERLQNHPRDFIHPGPAGHALIAEELDKYFYSSPLLARTP